MMWMSCSHNVVIDNAGDQPATVEIGNVKYEIESKQSLEISLDPGEYRISVTSGDGSGKRDTTVDIAEGGLINAGGGKYLVWKLLYGIADSTRDLITEKRVVLDSVIYKGDIAFIGPKILFVEKSWGLGLEEEFPEDKTLLVTEDYEVVSKIFRKKEFIETYRSFSSSRK